MGLESPLLHDGSQTTAASDLSAKQYYAVKLTAARQVDLASSGGEAIYGILQNTPLAAEAADNGIFGVSKAILGTGGCAAGASLQTEAATGKLITKSASNVVVAVALEAGNAGDIISVKIIPTPG